ncbi:MAG: hypothetical protein ACYCO5_06860 [Acidobacteriaceae bacterium]
MPIDFIEGDGIGSMTPSGMKRRRDLNGLRCDLRGHCRPQKGAVGVPGEDAPNVYTGTE